MLGFVAVQQWYYVWVWSCIYKNFFKKRCIFSINLLLMVDILMHQKLIFQLNKPYYFAVLYVFHGIQMSNFYIKSNVIVIDFEAYFGTKMQKKHAVFFNKWPFLGHIWVHQKIIFQRYNRCYFGVNYVFHAIQLFRFYIKSNVFVIGFEAYFCKKTTCFIQ